MQPKPKQTKPKWFYLVPGGHLHQEQVHAGIAYHGLASVFFGFPMNHTTAKDTVAGLKTTVFQNSKLATLEEFILMAWVLLCAKMLLNIRLSQF